MADRTGALTFYGVASLILIGGAAIAAGRFPGGFDWAYTVASGLASRKHNPEGGMWFAGALALAMILLLPVTSHLDRASATIASRPRLSIAVLRIGLVCGTLLGAERLFIYHLSDLVHKGHEILALVTFLGLYAGTLGLFFHRVRHNTSFVGPALLIAFPLIAVGTSQFALYIDQRDLGWVDTGWREIGVPLWLSFAFWQWLAFALLWAALGYLIATRRGSRPMSVAAVDSRLMSCPEATRSRSSPRASTR